MRKFKKNLLVLFAACVAIVGPYMVICNSMPVDIDVKAKELKKYCSAGGYNTDYAILVDYGRLSLQKRLFVYDLNRDKVVMRSFAGHGSGGKSTFLKADFSNSHGSHCSSLGHYKVGRNRKMYNYTWVPAYELKGLDKTNSNAMARGILIHPAVGPLSLGCVTLPLYRYHQLSMFLKTQRNVILWTYE